MADDADACAKGEAQRVEGRIKADATPTDAVTEAIGISNALGLPVRIYFDVDSDGFVSIIPGDAASSLIATYQASLHTKAPLVKAPEVKFSAGPSATLSQAEIDDEDVPAPAPAPKAKKHK